MEISRKGEKSMALVVLGVVAIVAVIGLVLLFARPGVTGADSFDDDETCSAGFSCVPGDDDAFCPAGLICETECDDDDDDGVPDCGLKECEFDGVDDGDDLDDGICAKAACVPAGPCDPRRNPCPAGQVCTIARTCACL